MLSWTSAITAAQKKRSKFIYEYPSRIHGRGGAPARLGETPRVASVLHAASAMQLPERSSALAGSKT